MYRDSGSTFCFYIIIKKFRTFKIKENIHKKEFGPYHGFGYKSLISDPIIWQKEPEEYTVNLQILIMAVVLKTDMSKKNKIFQIC